MSSIGAVRFGVVFPTIEIGPDPQEVRRFATEVEAMGFDHLITFDHVVGADPTAHAPLAGPYTDADAFHEPMVLFGHLAAVCTLELVTGILVLPQRQTVLLAKQAAEVDVLSGGRLRLGVGIGWNSMEYEALGMDFDGRAGRLGEQIDLMRRLWTGDTISYRGRDHTLTAGSVLPAPVRRNIPVWIGCGKHEAALTRVARFADGWIPLPMRPESYAQATAFLSDRLAAERRDSSAFGLQGMIRDCRIDDLDRVATEIELWRSRGATHIAFDAMRQGFTMAEEHLEVFDRIKQLAGL